MNQEETTEHILGYFPTLSCFLRINEEEFLHTKKQLTVKLRKNFQVCQENITSDTDQKTVNSYWGDEGDELMKIHRSIYYQQG